MASLNIKTLELQEGALITKKVLNTVEENMANIKTYVEGISHAVEANKVDDSTTTNASCAEKLNDILSKLTTAEFMQS